MARVQAASAAAGARHDKSQDVPVCFTGVGPVTDGSAGPMRHDTLGTVTKVDRIESELRLLSNEMDTFEQLHWLIDSNCFKVFIGLTVGANTITMGLEADNPTWESTWSLCENLFTTVFTIEAMLKIAVLKRAYFEDKWNDLDFMVVVLSICDTWLLGIFVPDLDLQSLSILRILRLLRLMRVLRLVKAFRKLVLVIRGVVEALQSTCWVACVLLVAIYVGAIFCVRILGPARLRQQHIADLYPGNSEAIEEIDEMEFMTEFNPYISFGSVPRAMVTLFNIAILAEWTEIVKPLMVKEPTLVVFFVVFVMFVTFGIMNVIIGMIVDNVMQGAREIQEEEREIERQKKLQALSDVRSIASELDQDGDGHISLGELSARMFENSSPFKTMLDKMSLHLPTGFTAEELVCLLDEDSDDSLALDNFVQSFYRLIDSTMFQQTCIMQSSVNQVKRLVRKNLERQDRMDNNVKSLSRELIRSGVIGNFQWVEDAQPKPPAGTSHAAAACWSDSESRSLGVDCGGSSPTATRPAAPDPQTFAAVIANEKVSRDNQPVPIVLPQQEAIAAPINVAATAIFASAASVELSCRFDDALYRIEERIERLAASSLMATQQPAQIDAAVRVSLGQAMADAQLPQLDVAALHWGAQVMSGGDELMPAPQQDTKQRHELLEVLITEEGALGLEVHWRGGAAPTVVAASLGSQAQKLGVLPGDVLVAFNSDCAVGRTQEEVLRLLQKRPLKLFVRRSKRPVFI